MKFLITSSLFIGSIPIALVLLVIKKVMLITKTLEIDMGHRIPNHKSKCRNLHGHRYKIEVGVDDQVIEAKGRSDEGMVMDFSDLKEVLTEVIDKGFDHGFVMYDHDEYWMLFEGMQREGQKIIFVPFVPTVENLAKWWFYLLKPKLEEKNIKLSFIKVWETPTSSTTYDPSKD